MVKQVTIERALQIPGYMTESELQWLAKRASEHKSIVELGCFYGRSTVAMAANTDGIIYAVDDFYGPRDDGINTEVDPNLNRNRIYDEYLSYTHPYKNIKTLNINHEDFYPHVIFDMVFIDGSHQYEHVRRDISKFIGYGNFLIAGHDIDFPTVRQAVVELLGDYEEVPHSSIWFKNV